MFTVFCGEKWKRRSKKRRGRARHRLEVKDAKSEFQFGKDAFLDMVADMKDILANAGETWRVSIGYLVLSSVKLWVRMDSV